MKQGNIIILELRDFADGIPIRDAKESIHRADVVVVNMGNGGCYIIKNRWGKTDVKVMPEKMKSFLRERGIATFDFEALEPGEAIEVLGKLKKARADDGTITERDAFGRVIKKTWHRGSLPHNSDSRPMMSPSKDPYNTHGCLDPDTWPDLSKGKADMHDVFDGRR